MGDELVSLWLAALSAKGGAGGAGLDGPVTVAAT